MLLTNPRTIPILLPSWVRNIRSFWQSKWPIRNYGRIRWAIWYNCRIRWPSQELLTDIATNLIYWQTWWTIWYYFRGGRYHIVDEVGEPTWIIVEITGQSEILIEVYNLYYIILEFRARSDIIYEFHNICDTIDEVAGIFEITVEFGARSDGSSQLEARSDIICELADSSDTIAWPGARFHIVYQFDGPSEMLKNSMSNPTLVMNSVNPPMLPNSVTHLILLPIAVAIQYYWQLWEPIRNYCRTRSVLDSTLFLNSVTNPIWTQWPIQSSF